MEPVDGSLSSLLRRLAYAAVVELAPETVVGRPAPDLLVSHDLSQRSGAIIVTLGGDDEELAKRLKALLGTWAVRKTDVIVVGPEDRGLALKMRAKPRLARGRLYWSGVNPDGSTWGEDEGGPLRAKLPRILDPDSELDWAQLEEGVRRSEGRAREQQGFAARLKSRKPWVTYALASANLAMFALLVAVAGTEPNVPGLIRMGGMSTDLVMEGEVWRLVSAAFLHGGFMHLGFNVFVLVALGGFIERIVGHARFLVLYTACALAGGVASALFMDASVSVGASGALWGILAAHAVFAFAPGFLPAVAVSGARRAAVINLGLNVLVSFRPHVDWAAHFGGGLVGAGLLCFVLARGVPRGDEIATRSPTPLPGQRVVVGLCAALLFTGAVAGPTLGGAFAALESTPTYERVAIGGTSATIDVPRGLEPAGAVPTEEGQIIQTFGDVLRDRVVVGVTYVYLGEIPEQSIPAELDGLREAMSVAPEHATNIGAPETIDVAGSQGAVRASYRFESDLRLDVVVVLADGNLLRAEAYYFSTEAEYGAGVAHHVAESLQVP